MKKATCPNCGLVNLEKFVSFPHCAGCGTLLAANSGEKPVFWRRRLGAPLWASLVGLGCVALGVAAIGVARETALSDDANLLVYVQVPRRVKQGEIMFAQFNLDTTEGAPSFHEFPSLRLRLARETLAGMQLLSMEPRPSETVSNGSGRYFIFKNLAREIPLKLSLRALQPGRHRFGAAVFAPGFYGFIHNSTFTVQAASQPLVSQK